MKNLILIHKFSSVTWSVPSCVILKDIKKLDGFNGLVLDPSMFDSVLTDFIEKMMLLSLNQNKDVVTEETCDANYCLYCYKNVFHVTCTINNKIMLFHLWLI